MAAELLFTIICDDIRVENTGKLIVIGLYNGTINFAKAAAPEGQGGEPKYALPHLCFLRRWRLDSDKATVKMELVEPSGNIRKYPEVELQKQDDYDYAQEIMRTVGVVLSPGKYTIVVSVVGPNPRKYEDTFWVREV